LTKIPDEEKFARLVAAGVIRPDMERSEITNLAPDYNPPPATNNETPPIHTDRLPKAAIKKAAAQLENEKTRGARQSKVPQNHHSPSAADSSCARNPSRPQRWADAVQAARV